MSRGVLGAVTLVFLASCGQPIRLESKGDEIIIDVQALGEYPSDVAKIELINSSSGKVAWNVVPRRGDRFQIHTVRLRAGENAAEPLLSWGEALVKVPTTPPLVLEAGVQYRVEVCAPGWFGRCRTANFTLPAVAAPSNSTQQLTRPGAGPAAKLP